MAASSLPQGRRLRSVSTVAIYANWEHHNQNFNLVRKRVLLVQNLSSWLVLRFDSRRSQFFCLSDGPWNSSFWFLLSCRVVDDVRNDTIVLSCATAMDTVRFARQFTFAVNFWQAAQILFCWKIRSFSLCGSIFQQKPVRLTGGLARPKKVRRFFP